MFTAVTENAPTVQQAQAEAVIGQRLPETDLGPPDLIALPPEGGVLLVWNPGPTTLWILPTIDTADSRMRKLLDEVDTIEPVFELGEGAVFVHESVLAAGLLSAGVDVRLLGPMPTPAVA